MIDLSSGMLEIIVAILDEHVPDCEVWAFGSRVNGTAREFSDLDLALRGQEKMDWRRIERLKDAFSASDLPIIVDVLDWHALTDEFRSVIEQDYVVLTTHAAGS